MASVTEDEVFEAFRKIAADGGLPPPARLDAVLAAEVTLGCQLPRLLRRLLLQVANGSFGPGEGILGVAGGIGHGDYSDIADAVRGFGPPPPGTVPPGVYLLYDWGCGMWSLIDFTDPAGAMWGADHGTFFPEDINFAEWLARSLDGTLPPPNQDDHPDGIRISDYLSHHPKPICYASIQL